MKITRIAADGVKGRSFDHELSPITVFLGENRDGKTARLDAVRLALAGYLPELGKTNSATGKVFSGVAARVQADTDGGDRIVRTWQLAKGSWKADALVPETMKAPPVLIDPGQYFGLGATDRRRMIFAATNIEGVTTGEAVIAKLHGITVDNWSDHHVTALREVVTHADQTDRDRNDNMGTVQDWLGTLITTVTDWKRLAGQNVERMAKTVQGLTVLACQDTEETVANVERELAALTKRRDDMVAEGGAIKATLNALLARQSRIHLPPPAIPAKVRESIGQEILDAETAAMALVPDPVPVDERRAAQQARDRAWEWQNRFASDIANARASVAEFEKLQAEIEGMECCPFCHSKGKTWRNVLQRETNTKLVLARSKLAQFTDALNEAIRNTDKAAEYLEALDARDKKAAEVANRRNDLKAKVETLLRERSEGELRWTRYEKALAEWKNREQAPSEAEVAKAQEAVTAHWSVMQGFNQKIQGLTTRQNIWKRFRDESAMQAKCKLALAEAEARYDVMKAAVKVLSDVQTEMVEAAFAAILNRANEVIGDVFPVKLAYRDQEIGYWRGHDWVSHETFSGSEKLLCYAAISLALAGDCSIRVLLFDDLGRLDSEAKADLFKVMSGLIEAGKVDQVIATDATEASFYDTDGTQFTLTAIMV